MLKKSDNTTTRRQEIGRGLRLAVDQHGERMDNAVTVHDINELTVVTDESYTEFVTALQREIVESLSARPRKATPEFFAGKFVEVPGTGEKVAITLDQAKQLQHWLIKNDFIDYDQQLTEKWFNRAAMDMPAMPAGLEQVHHQVAEMIDSLHVAAPAVIDGRKPKKIPLNEKNFAKKEFQELWSRINYKAVYQVAFDSTELIRNCIWALDHSLKVSAMQYIVQKGVQIAALEAEQLAAGEGFKVTTSKIEESSLSARSTVQYDLLGEIAEKTQLTRRTCSAILTGVLPTTFANFKQNPEQFITEAARLINEQKATAIVEHLTYDPIDDRYDVSIFTENQTAQDLSTAGDKLKKSVYEYVATDSKVERRFVTELDVSEEVAVYAKLPRGFFIPTPVGNYNPDWAIAFHDGKVKHVYFIAETKGSLSTLQLKGAEQAKIECARKFFASLNEKKGNDVKYDVVTDYSELMALVSSA
jgi:type III restriction enzyme